MPNDIVTLEGFQEITLNSKILSLTITANGLSDHFKKDKKSVSFLHDSSDSKNEYLNELNLLVLSVVRMSTFVA